MIHQDNGGASKARNVALSAASGEYIAFCDADDFYMPRILEELTSLALKYSKDVCMCGFVMVDEEGTVYDEKKMRMPVA